MRIKAKLLPASHIHKSWRLQGRIGGEIHGVYFKLRTNQEYISDEVPPQALQYLNAHRHVQLEVMSEPITIDIKLEPQEPPKAPDPVVAVVEEPVVELPPPPEEPVVEEAASEMVEESVEEAAAPKRRGRPAKVA